MEFGRATNTLSVSTTCTLSIQVIDVALSFAVRSAAAPPHATSMTDNVAAINAVQLNLQCLTRTRIIDRSLQ